jgi:2-C-methyl-D-erythritol 4-phosphate cytidylyltransferase
MLLLAAGRGSRFGGPVPKAFLRLGGRALVVVAAERLLRAVPTAAVARLVVLVHPDDRATHLAACLPQLQALTPSGGLQVVDGGATRQESMQRGLAAAGADSDLILVHDAARALLPVAASLACIEAAAAHGAALLAVPAPDTLKRVHDRTVTATVDRNGIWLAQTPQVIRRELLQRALAHARATGFEGTDDVSLVEHLGEPVVVVPGAVSNLKITHPDDLPLAAALLAAESA